MFAVKGWSVSADNLKAEVPKAATANGETKKSKKRKRQAQNVDTSNVADLWESVIDGQEGAPGGKIEGQATEKKAKKGNKRQKHNADEAPSQEDAETAKEKTSQAAGSPHGDKKVSLKEKKKAKKAKDKQKAQEGDSASPAKDVTTVSKPAKSNNTTTTTTSSVPPAAQPKLTPLQASMREKLISARFRHLNETLYTRPSADALSLFDESPEMFTEYHEGFRRQVEVWPENPVEGYLVDIRARARARYPSKHRKPAADKQQQSESATADKALEPLPRNRDTNLCTIADLGCGDARLAAELAKDKSKLKVEILSFDLSSPQPFVTKADIANLPLANGTVDVAIFCLALMGTNWVDFIEEAYRILRWKGELWVAEIKSRFGPPGGGKKVVEHSVGNRRNKAAAGPAGGSNNKKSAAAAAKENKGAADETTLLVEVDGVDDTRQQTDVSAFVKVLNARGFMLAGQDQGRGEEAVDLSNRMFVKMRFIKCAPATKGKCVRKEEAAEKSSRLGGKLQTMAKKPKFIDNEVEVDEAGVLKPCVYKLR